MLPLLLAERQLLAIEASSIPHMKDEARREVFARLERAVTGTKRKSATEALLSLPINVVEIPKR